MSLGSARPVATVLTWPVARVVAADRTVVRVRDQHRTVRQRAHARADAAAAPASAGPSIMPEVEQPLADGGVHRRRPRRSAAPRTRCPRPTAAIRRPTRTDRTAAPSTPRPAGRRAAPRPWSRRTRRRSRLIGSNHHSWWMPAIATMTRSSYQARSHGDDRSTDVASCGVVVHGARATGWPVPATVVTSPVGQFDAAQQVVDRVGDDHVVPDGLGDLPRGSRHRPCGSANWPASAVRRRGRACPCRSGAPGVSPSAPARPAMLGRVGDQVGAVAQRRAPCPGTAAPCRRRRRHVRAVATVQGALRLVRRRSARRSAAPGPRRDPRRPWWPRHSPRGRPRQRRPRLGRVLLPGDQLRIVEHRVLDVVALDRGGQRVRVLLVLELRRVHADRRRARRAYFSSSGRSSSSTCRQLMQQKVQKSSRTILPRKSGQRQVLAAGVQPAATLGTRERVPSPPDHSAGRVALRRCGPHYCRCIHAYKYPAITACNAKLVNYAAFGFAGSWGTASAVQPGVDQFEIPAVSRRQRP